MRRNAASASAGICGWRKKVGAQVYTGRNNPNSVPFVVRDSGRKHSARRPSSRSGSAAKLSQRDRTMHTLSIPQRYPAAQSACDTTHVGDVARHSFRHRQRVPVSARPCQRARCRSAAPRSSCPRRARRSRFAFFERRLRSHGGPPRSAIVGDEWTEVRAQELDGSLSNRLTAGKATLASAACACSKPRRNTPAPQEGRKVMYCHS